MLYAGSKLLNPFVPIIGIPLDEVCFWLVLILPKSLPKLYINGFLKDQRIFFSNHCAFGRSFIP